MAACMASWAGKTDPDRFLAGFRYSASVRARSSRGQIPEPGEWRQAVPDPEESMRIQRVLNSDVVMIFDECTLYPATREEAAHSMRLSLRWAERSRRAHEGNPNAVRHRAGRHV